METLLIASMACLLAGAIGLMVATSKIDASKIWNKIHYFFLTFSIFSICFFLLTFFFV